MKTCDELIHEWGGLSGGTPEQYIYDYMLTQIDTLNQRVKNQDHQIKMLRRENESRNDGKNSSYTHSGGKGGWSV
jgi:hypothetical protein